MSKTPEEKKRLKVALILGAIAVMMFATVAYRIVAYGP